MKNSRYLRVRLLYILNNWSHKECNVTHIVGKAGIVEEEHTHTHSVSMRELAKTSCVDV